MAGSASAEFGLVVTGELLSVQAGRTYQGRNGSVTPGEIRLLVGDSVYAVNFPTLDDARAAVGDTPERAPLALRVAPRLAGARDATSRAWVEWRAVRNGR